MSVLGVLKILWLRCHGFRAGKNLNLYYLALVIDGEAVPGDDHLLLGLVLLLPELHHAAYWPRLSAPAPLSPQAGQLTASRRK